MKSLAWTFLSTLLVCSVIFAASDVSDELKPQPVPSEWVLPDCERVVGTACYTYTTDEGLSFAPTRTLRQLTYTNGLAVMDTPNTLLAAHVFNYGSISCNLLLRSEDAGCSWDEIAQIPVGFEIRLVSAPGGQAYGWSPNQYRIYWYDGRDLHEFVAPEWLLGIAVNPDDAANIRIGTHYGQLYESFDNGASFTKIGVAVPDGKGDNAVVFDPKDWDNAFCGGKGAWRTTDGGNTWRTVNSFDPLQDIVYDFIYSGGDRSRVYALAKMYSLPGDLKCILVSDNGGKQFEVMVDETDQAVDQFGNVRTVILRNSITWAAHPDNSGVLYFIYGFYRDAYGTDFYKLDLAADELSVTHTDSLDGIGSIAFHPADPNLMYVGFNQLVIPFPKADAGGSAGNDMAVKVSPNPFNPTANISFSLPAAAHVRLEVYNIAGQRVATLVDRYMNAGEHVCTWNAEGAASGVYLYRLQAGENVESQKMLLLR